MKKKIVTPMVIMLLTILCSTIIGCKGDDAIVIPATEFDEISALEGVPGAAISIYGTSLDQSPKVIIGNVEIAVEVINSEELSFIVPKDLGSGKMEILVDDEPLFEYKYFKVTEDGFEEILTTNEVITGHNFTTPEIGFRMDLSAKVSKTIDGGMTWDFIRKASNSQSLHVIDEKNLWINKKPWILEKSTDGGANWIEVQINGLIIRDVSFTDAENGWAVTSDPNSVDALYKTIDGGQSWIEVYSENYPAIRNFKFSFAKDNSVVLVDYVTDEILKSGDGGSSWSTSSLNMNLPSSKPIYFMDKDNLWLWSYQSGIYKSTNGGGDWILNEYEVDLNSSMESIASIKFFDQDNGIVFGNDGVILRTNDGGATWKVTYLPGSVGEVDYLIEENVAIINYRDCCSSHSRLIKLPL